MRTSSAFVNVDLFSLIYIHLGYSITFEKAQMSRLTVGKLYAA